MIFAVVVHCRSVYACEACQPPPLSITTVSKRVMRKTTVDDTDSNSAESGGDVHGDGVISEKPRLPRYSNSFPTRNLFESLLKIKS